MYNFLGRNRKLGLTGRRSLDVGIQAPSRFYQVQDKIYVFTPQSFDKKMNYTDTDPCLAMSTLAYGKKRYCQARTFVLVQQLFQNSIKGTDFVL